MRYDSFGVCVDFLVAILDQIVILAVLEGVPVLLVGIGHFCAQVELAVGAESAHEVGVVQLPVHVAVVSPNVVQDVFFVDSDTKFKSSKKDP